MRVYFDTNVLVSAFVGHGYTFDVIKDAIYKHDLYYTEFVLEEMQRILTEKLKLTDEVTLSAVSVVKKYFERGKTSKTVKKICRDEKDNQILADIVENKIDLLMTGDKDLLVLKKYEGIKIIEPKEYWNL
ncbi:MAG: putative toxin-antitoxin system toxin component, PIN family [Candidatus Omnitrophota bacterium]